MHTFSEGHLELPYGHGFMSHKNICLVCVHFVLRTPNQLLLATETDDLQGKAESRTTQSWVPLKVVFSENLDFSIPAGNQILVQCSARTKIPFKNRTYF